jgi:hypothetical protein
MPDGQMVKYRNTDPDVSWFSPDDFRRLGFTIREWMKRWLEQGVATRRTTTRPESAAGEERPKKPKPRAKRRQKKDSK